MIWKSSLIIVLEALYLVQEEILVTINKEFGVFTINLKNLICLLSKISLVQLVGLFMAIMKI